MANADYYWELKYDIIFGNRNGIHSAVKNCVSVILQRSLSVSVAQHRVTPENKTTHTHTHTHTTILRLFFSGTTGVSRCQKKTSSGLYGAREDSIGRHTDNRLGVRHSVWTSQQPIAFIPPPFLWWMPFLPQSSQFILACIGTRYAGLYNAYPGAWLPSGLVTPEKETS